MEITPQTDGASDVLTAADVDARPIPGKLRPSTLPKMAECRCYLSTPADSKAAARGHAIDTAMREALTTGTIPDTIEGLNEEDMAAVRWGVGEIVRLADGANIVAKESDLRLDLHNEVLPDFEEGAYGTMDAHIPDKQIIIDFKTGQVRSYKEQMAAYALAMMNRSRDDFFMAETDTYEAVCVFVDQQHLERYIFTREEAEAALRAVIDKTIAPTPCEYCTWCGHFTKCPMTKKALQDVTNLAAQLPEATPGALSARVIPSILETLVDDHEAAAQIFDAISRATAWMQLVRKSIADKLGKGGTSTVFRLTKETTTKKVLPLAIGRYLREFGTDRLLSLFEPVSLTKFAKTWKEVMRDKPIPEEMITEESGARQLRRIPAKKASTK